MKNSPRAFLAAAGSSLAIMTASPSLAQSANSGASDLGVGEIVVTASKREEKLQDLGLTVTALGGEALATRRIENVEDLAKAVPGLAYAPSPNATPVYTMRGVGFLNRR